jgi:uncharacterized coiled-coil protein SlyX
MSDREVPTSTGRRRAGPGTGRRGGSIVEPDSRIVGVSKRIWFLFAVLVLMLAGTGFLYFRAQGALDATRAALGEARAKTKELEIVLSHAVEAKEQATADKELLVKELRVQGSELAEYSRGEEKARSEAAQASTGIEAAEKRSSSLEAKLAEAEKDITALTAELEVTRAELKQAREQLEHLRATSAPYATPPQEPSSRAPYGVQGGRDAGGQTGQ